MNVKILTYVHVSDDRQCILDGGKWSLRSKSLQMYAVPFDVSELLKAIFFR